MPWRKAGAAYRSVHIMMRLLCHHPEVEPLRHKMSPQLPEVVVVFEAFCN